MNLEDWLRQDPSLSDRLKVLEGLCRALNEAHARGRVHQALEPGHIELRSDGSCDLSDAVSGTAAQRYRAPEVLESGRAATTQSDIYAVGVICYEALSGRSPSGEPPKPLSELRPDIPQDLTDAIMGCLEKGQDWRPKDLSYLLQVLSTLHGGAARPAPQPVPRTTQPARSVTPKASVARRPATAGRKPARRSNLPLLAVVVVIAVGAALGGRWYLDQQGTAPAAGGSALPPRPGPVPSLAPSAAPTTLVTLRPEIPVARTPEPAIQPELPVTTTATPPPPPPTPPPTPLPVPRPLLVQPATPPPAPTREPVASTLPPQPAVLTTVAPLTLRRGSNTLLDVHGTGLRPDHQVVIVRVKEAPIGITVVRQKYTDATLIQALVRVDASVIPGAYALALSDGRGEQTNGLAFTVSK